MGNSRLAFTTRSLYPRRHLSMITEGNGVLMPDNSVVAPMCDRMNIGSDLLIVDINGDPVFGKAAPIDSYPMDVPLATRERALLRWYAVDRSEAVQSVKCPYCEDVLNERLKKQAQDEKESR